jgi:outer membrane immunogenic protein
MRRYTFAALAAAGIALGFVQTASAADIARPVYKAPVIIPAYNWSGFYIGGNVGYGTGDLNATAFGYGWSTGVDGWSAGGQLGYNHASGTCVAGIEADFSGFDFQAAKIPASSIADWGPTPASVWR